MRNTKVKMRPRLVTAIASGFMILSTLLCCTYIIVNHFEAKKLAAIQEENIKKQAIANNIKIGDANEGILPETQNNASSPTTEAALTRRRLLVVLTGKLGHWTRRKNGLKHGIGIRCICIQTLQVLKYLYHMVLQFQELIVRNM